VRLLEHFVSADPASRVWGGRTIFLGGSTGLRRAAPGVRIGDLSGIAAATQPFWARLFTSPPPRIAILSDWDRKLDLLARGSIGADIRAIAGQPMWLLAFFDRVSQLYGGKGGSPADWFPNLELIVHGGVLFAPYRATFQYLLGNSRIRRR